MNIMREDKEGPHRVAAMNYSFFNAPQAAFLFMPSFGDNVRVAGDIGMYGQTFLLSLAARGLGGIPQTSPGFFADPIREFLGVSDEFKLLFGISFGYPDESAPENSWFHRPCLCPDASAGICVLSANQGSPRQEAVEYCVYENGDRCPKV